MEIFTIAFVVSSYQSRIIGPANGVDFEFLKKQMVIILTEIFVLKNNNNFRFRN